MEYLVQPIKQEQNAEIKVLGESNTYFWHHVFFNLGKKWRVVCFVVVGNSITVKLFSWQMPIIISNKLKMLYDKCWCSFEQEHWKHMLIIANA